MNIAVIVNPVAANGHAGELFSLVRSSNLPGVSVETTARPGHARQLALGAVRAGARTVVAVGGDGTVNEVINGIAGSGASLGIIPAGTANDLAVHQRIPPAAGDAWRTVLHGRTKAIDLISVNGWLYATAGGIGFPCVVARLANELRSGISRDRVPRFMQRRLYSALTLGMVLGRRRTDIGLTIRAEGTEFKTRAFSFMVDNQPFVGERYHMSPGAVNDDGRFDVCLVENIPDGPAPLRIVRSVAGGRHTELPCVRTWTGNELQVCSDEPVRFFGDGEVSPPESVFTIRLIPRGLHLIVPEGERP